MRHHDDPERGSVLVLVGAAMAALAVLVAIVVDLGGARRDRDADQTAADAMALAAASNLNLARYSAVGACTSAWTYVVVNLPTAETKPSPNCTVFGTKCIGTTAARTVTTTIDEYDITFTHPVPDSDPLMAGQPSDEMDGTQCDRFGIQIEQERTNVVHGGTTELDVHAVGRIVRGVGNVEAPLILLEPHACEALTLNGGGKLTVELLSGEPGYINIDSDATTCAAGQHLVLDTVGTSTIKSGAITMWALAGDNAAKAFDPADTGLFNFDNPRISPTPIPSDGPVGRSAMDWRYNCKEDNGCPNAGTTPAYIDLLYSTHQPTGTNPSPALASATLQHGPYVKWTDHYPCGNVGTMTVPTNNWWINCSLSTNGTLTFQGGNVVSNQAISVTGSGKLRVNCASASATIACPTDPASPAIFYQRTGDLVRNTDLEMYETFVYLASGTVQMGGNGRLYWTAPNDPSYPFDDLLVWTEQAIDMSLRGTSDMTLEGTWFTPNARVTVAGDTGTTALNAQIFSNKMDIAGNSTFKLVPKENRSTPVGRGRTLLIR